MLIEDVDRELRKFFGVKARIVSDEEGRIFSFTVNVICDSGHGKPHVGKGEIVGDEAAPTGSSKLNGRRIRRRVHGDVF